MCLTAGTTQAQWGSHLPWNRCTIALSQSLENLKFHSTFVLWAFGEGLMPLPFPSCRNQRTLMVQASSQAASCLRNWESDVVLNLGSFLGGMQNCPCTRKARRDGRKEGTGRSRWVGGRCNEQGNSRARLVWGKMHRSLHHLPELPTFTERP